MLEVEEIWRRIDAQISAQTPQFNGLLNPPADQSQIAATEAHIGMSLPPSVRRSYLVHDGECDDTDGLFDVWQFLPLAGIQTWWDEMKLIEETHSFGDFDVHLMIPIMFREGDLCYVDHSADGAETPLFEWHHENPTRNQRATSFAAFLAKFLDDFESKQLVAEPEYDLKAIVPRLS